MSKSSLAAAEALAAPSRSTLRRGIVARMAGPGGYYNAGNLLGLAVGLTLQMMSASDPSGRGAESAFAVAGDYFFGAPSATALTVATVVFLWSGEIYHRAWAAEPGARQRLVRRADLLSCLGAVILSIALLLVGEPLLAATSGVLLAGGKLGTALADASRPIGRRLLARAQLFRSMVLLSRAPALLSVVAEMARLSPTAGASASAYVAPSALLICYLLWARADLLLFGDLRRSSTA